MRFNNPSTIDYALALANVGTFERLHRPAQRFAFNSAARINARQGLVASRGAAGRAIGTRLFSASTTPFTITKNRAFAW